MQHLLACSEAVGRRPLSGLCRSACAALLGLAMLIAACGGGADSADGRSDRAGTSAVTASAASTGTTSSTSRSRIQAVPAVGSFTANGWFWNPAEAGTGFMFEAQAQRGFVAFFMYEEGSGKPIWYAAYGDLVGQEGGSYRFSGDLRYYTLGQAVFSPAYRSPQSVSVGAVQIVFSGNSATVSLPGGRMIAGTRFDYAGLGSAITEAQPETGWYWNPNEGGRGYGIEVQNNQLFLAMFHYNADGTPTWNVAQGDLKSGVLTTNFQLYHGGQSLASVFRPPSQNDVGTYTVSFRNRCAGQVGLAGAPAVSIRRFRIDGSPLPPAAECRTLANGIADVGTSPSAAPRLDPGDAIYGLIDAAGDVDTYSVRLRAGRSYQFDVLGSSTANGTLGDPYVDLLGPNLQLVGSNADIGPGQTDARLTYTALTDGIHYLRVSGSNGSSGSFLASVSGVSPSITEFSPTALASFAGSLTGVQLGGDTGAASLVIDTAGRISGSVIFNSRGVSAPVTGSVVGGGAVQLSASVAGASYQFSGYLDPLGRLSGSWSTSSGAMGLLVAAAAGATVTYQTPIPSCYDGTAANAVGIDDPLAANAWHLRNTGSTQAVSAVFNAQAVAGVDANVQNVHKGGRGCTGKGVITAVVDTDLELMHEDLRDNVLPGRSFNFENNSTDPSPADTPDVTHGTSVSGVLAAKGWNGLGSRGMAPNASLQGFNLIESVIYPDNASGVRINATLLSFGGYPMASAGLAATPLFGNRADAVSVFNYSAGTPYDTPATVYADATLGSYPWMSARYGVSALRGGAGALYFQSAGNAFQRVSFSSRTVDCSSFRTADTLGGILGNATALSCGNSNQEPYGQPELYKVAAVSNDGRAASYSSAGANVWVTGFGGEFGTGLPAIVTTDAAGCGNGINNRANQAAIETRYPNDYGKLVADRFGANPADPNCNYTGRMNGTSAAAPSVSGVAALMLEANPRLSWRDVGYILARTARQVDESVSKGGRVVIFTKTGASGQVRLEDPWIVNAAGFTFHNRYGFGLVDADAAVRMATNYQPPAARRTADIAMTGSTALLGTADAGNGGRNYVATVAFAQPSQVSGPMRLELNLSNTGSVAINPGTLQFELLNRSTGTRSILMPAFTSWFNGGQTAPIPVNGSMRFRLVSNAFYGETLGGTFEVTVRGLMTVPAGSTHSFSYTPRLVSHPM